MLIGILGDVHGNIDALEAVYSRLCDIGVERMLCTGDLVGYGAAPGDCIDFMRKHGIPCVLGNHDAYTVDPELSLEAIREEASVVFRWNRKVLSRQDLDWLSSLPMSLDVEDVQIRHCSCVPYPDWDYVVSSRSASSHFLFQRSRIVFNGHSHLPVLAMHCVGNPVIFTHLRNMILPRGMSIMIGVGAVGQPRDGDPRASCVVYDTTENRITLERVSYDIGAAQKRILEARLPESLAYRLAAGR